MSMAFGVAYLALGLSLSATIVSRLYQYWTGFVRAQKALLMGVLVIMFGFTQRGIELIWFDAPPPRPAAYMAVIGASMCLFALLSPVDDRLRPESWRDTLKTQEPELADKYLEILARSQTNRKLDNNSESTVDNGFDERHASN